MKGEFGWAKWQSRRLHLGVTTVALNMIANDVTSSLILLGGPPTHVKNSNNKWKCGG